mgnify:CR=1 FL=1
MRIINSSNGHDRNVQRLFDLVDRLNQAGFLHKHWLGNPLRRYIIAGRNLNQVNACIDQYFQNFDTFIGCKSAVNIFLGADLKGYGDFIADTFADLYCNLSGEAGSACHIPTVFIFTDVGKSRKKLIDQISMGAVDLNQLESGHPGPCRGDRTVPGTDLPLGRDGGALPREHHPH